MRSSDPSRTRTRTILSDDVVDLSSQTGGDRPMQLTDLMALLAGPLGRDDFLLSDGSGANRAASFQLGAAGAVQGHPCAFWGKIDVPSANPAATGWAGFLGSGQLAGGIPYSFEIQALRTDGGFTLRQIGATNANNRRDFSFSGFRALYSGVNDLPVYIGFPAGDSTTNPLVYIGGVDCSALFTLTTATDGAGVPNWMASTMVPTYFVSGYTWPAGRAPLFKFGVGNWTPAEVLTWAQTGREPSWCDAATGSAIAAGSYANPSFETDTASPPANWIATGNHVATAVVDGTAPSGGNVCEVVATAAGAESTNALEHSGPSNVAIIGSRNALYFWAKGVAGNTTLNVGFGGGNASQSFTLTAAWQLFRYEATLKAVYGNLRFWLSGAGTFRLDAISGPFVLGPIIKPVIQPCRVLDDAGANGISGVIVAGLSPVTKRKEWRLRAGVDMSTTGNKQLLGAAVFDNPLAQAIDMIEAQCSGSPGYPTFSVGDGTTATRYTASTAITTGRTRLGLSSNYPSASDKTGLYANVTATGGASEVIIVRGHRID